jgi:hypothetical protein
MKFPVLPISISSSRAVGQPPDQLKAAIKVSSIVKDIHTTSSATEYNASNL